MDAGRLDRRVTIEQRVETRSARSGAVSAETWLPLCKVAAKVDEVTPRRAERIDGGIDLAQRPVDVLIRWRGDVTAAMRVKYGNRALRIVSGPTELGRRSYLVMRCEEWSSEGLAP